MNCLPFRILTFHIAVACYTYISERLKELPHDSESLSHTTFVHSDKEEERNQGQSIQILDLNGNPIFIESEEETEEEEDEAENIEKVLSRKRSFLSISLSDKW